MDQRSKVAVLVRAVYMTVFYLLAGILIGSVAAAFSAEFYQSHLMLWTFFAAAVTIPFCLMQMRRDGYLEKEQSLSFGAISWDLWAAMAVLGISSCIALNYWIELSGLMRLFTGYDKVAQTIYQGNLFEELLAVVFAAPLVEELLFRGLAYNGFRRLWGSRVAMVVSALFFGVYHGNIVQFVYAFLIGLLLTYIYEVFGTIRASILFHMAANAVSVIMTECMDLRWLKESVPAMVALASFCTATGIFSFLLICKKRKLIKY